MPHDLDSEIFFMTWAFVHPEDWVAQSLTDRRKICVKICCRGSAKPPPGANSGQKAGQPRLLRNSPPAATDTLSPRGRGRPPTLLLSRGRRFGPSPMSLVTDAESEAEIQPHRIADHLRREPVTLERYRLQGLSHQADDRPSRRQVRVRLSAPTRPPGRSDPSQRLSRRSPEARLACPRLLPPGQRSSPRTGRRRAAPSRGPGRR